MPIIAKQHAHTDSDHIPHLKAEWPETCQVQWGSGGLVIGEGGSRVTAFFEAFPATGGFFRGEGVTIRDAEEQAYEQFARAEVCDHLWGRGTYTNGGCHCRRCGAFKSVMRPIVSFGDWRKPIDVMEIEMAISMYGLGPSPYDSLLGSRRRRKIWLRLRRAGFQLPHQPAEVLSLSSGYCGKSAYAQECSEVIFSSIHAKGGPEAFMRKRVGGGLERLFGAMAIRRLETEYEGWALKNAGNSALHASHLH